MSRVIAYVDGFNLYHGLREAKWRKYYWLNLQQLAKRLLLPGQNLVGVKYFTTRIRPSSRDPEKNKRQSLFLEALQTLGNFHIYYGHFVDKPAFCPKCGKWHTMRNEKMSDVNLAVELIKDAYEDRFDTAIVISADSDLSNAITAVRSLKGKQVVVWFPPKRNSMQLRAVANAWSVIGRSKLAQSQFPDRVQKADGFVLQRPDRWKGRGK